MWLHWPLVLRHRSRGTRLMLDTLSPASLYVNGSSMLRGWTGRRVVDLSKVLVPGLNHIAIHWAALARPGSGGLEAGLSVPAIPVLRYEWFVDDAPPRRTPRQRHLG